MTESHPVAPGETWTAVVDGLDLPDLTLHADSLGPNTSRKLERAMEKLGPGEAQEAKPEPATPPDQQQPPQHPRGPRGRRGGPPPTTT